MAMVRAYITRNYISVLSATFYVSLAFKLFTLFYFDNMGMGQAREQMPTWFKIVTLPFIAAWLFQYFLIFGRHLRDEYVEKIWQRSMRSFAVVIFVIPWLWLIAWLIHALFFRYDYWLLEDPNQFLMNFDGDNPRNISQLQKSGIDFVLYAMLDYSPMLFVILFKWHAWRDRH